MTSSTTSSTANPSAGSLPTAPVQSQWFSDLQPYSDTIIFGDKNSTQRPDVRLNVMFNLYSYKATAAPADAPREKFLLVSLQNSAVDPGSMLFDRDDKRGSYTESVQVTMCFPDSQVLVIRQDAPEASEEDGSVSSSISQNFGAGTFGDTVTASIGANIGNTVTQSLPDFEVVNNTLKHLPPEPPTVDHTFRLRLVEGNTYRNPPDLVNPSSYITRTLCHLPPRATSAFPLVSQALFHAPNGLTTPATLHIGLTHHLMCVEKTVAPLEWLHPSGGQVSYDPSKPNQRQMVHVGDLHLDISPTVASYSWDFPIPFDKVQ